MVSFSTSARKTSTRMPKFEQKSLLSNIPSSKITDPKTGQEIPIAVWDSWQVENPDGTVADFHGYRLVIGLTSKYQRDDANGVIWECMLKRFRPIPMICLVGSI